MNPFMIKAGGAQVNERQHLSLLSVTESLSVFFFFDSDTDPDSDPEYSIIETKLVRL